MAALSAKELQEEITELREIVQKYEPGKNVTIPDRITFPENLFIGLFGRTGCGKSSLINSLKFAALGRLRRAQWIAVATQEKAGGHTMFRKIANLTQCIYVIDNRGLDNPNAEQAQAEIRAQLDGRRGYSEQVQWADEGDRQATDTPAVNLSTGHPITCAVFVFSATHDIQSDFAGLNHVVDFFHRHQGCYPIAVVTHVDVAERKNIDVLEAVLRVSGFGDIYEVANITNEKTRLDEQYQLNLLNLIERCMTIGDDTAVFKHYQRVEIEKKTEIARVGQEISQEDGLKISPKDKVAVATKEVIRDVQHVDKAEKNPEWCETEEERRQVDKLKLELAKRTMELEFLQKSHKMKMEFERQQQQQLLIERQQLESREKQLQEEERERRFQEQLRKIEADKREELIRIMEANTSKGPGFRPVINIRGCPIQ